MNRTISIVAAAFLSSAALAGPDQSPPVADAVIDLRDTAAASSVNARWRFTEAHIVDGQNRAAGADHKPTGGPVAARDIHPRIGTPDFDAAPWQDVNPAALETRRTNGRLAFAWYRLDATIPHRFGGVDAAGATIVLEVVVDDYAEVWVNGALSTVLGSAGHALGSGWNAPARVTLTQNAAPGTRLDVAIFAANGPLSDPPANYIWIRSATLDVYRPGRAAAEAAVRVPTEFTRLDPAFDAIVPADATVERIATGFTFGEGPVWVPAVTDARYGGGGKGNYLLFSDPNKNIIHRWDPVTETVSIFRTKSGYSGVGGADMKDYFQPGSNGLALDPQGRVTICEHGNRRVTRLEPNGTITVLADRYNGKRLNSPNDCVYRSDGAIFFTDPPFGLPKAFSDPRRELDISGVYCLQGDSLTLAAADLAAPNGLAFSPDEKFLYVDNWEENRKVILRYEVAPDGALSSPITFFDMTHVQGEICLDGLKVDPSGTLLVSGPGGVWVISKEGKHLGTITPPELPANFAFGDADGRTLYMTARTGLYRMRLK